MDYVYNYVGLHVAVLNHYIAVLFCSVTQEHIAAVDAGVKACLDVSELCDDLAASIYPPVNPVIVFSHSCLSVFFFLFPATYTLRSSTLRSC